MNNAQPAMDSEDLLTHVHRCVILGIGNPLMGDDGVGIHVIRDLLAKPAALAFTGGTIEILDGGTLGYLLIDRLAGTDALIVVDAANIGKSAGEVQLFLNKEMDGFLSQNQTSSVHEVGLVDLVQMMTLMGQMPRHRALVGIQPSIIDWETELSPSLAQSVAKASDKIIHIVSKWYGVSTQCPI
ncbi:MAG: hydrogenase maturation protease [Candidatus Competibacteraceae bacterium]|nr:hydrogenase maturation protease [Candidatus Competibacteraceae bacterium]MBK8753522.1 hydrogenase maturation protease [Candidatus Competibacteraceae bacterium]